MRRALVIALACALVAVAFVARPVPVYAQKRQRVQLPEGTVLDRRTRPVMSVDGSIGFVAPALGDTVVAFAVRTGEVLSRLEGHGTATGLAIHDDGSRRLLAITCANDPENGKPSTVTIVDASDASELRVVSTFTLPETARLAPDARAEFARGSQFGVVPIVAPASALVTFDIASGQQVGALTLDGAPDQISISEAANDSRIAVVSSEANKVVVATVNDYGVVLPVASFQPPAEARLSATNNVAFDTSGRVGYVAALHGRQLFSFSLETGEIIDQIATNGSSAGIAVYHTPERDVLAVMNISRPGGEQAGNPAPDVAPTVEEPLGLPGAVLISANAEGKLSEQARFYPETGEEIADTNNPEFSADGKSVFVPVRTGSLYVINTKTGVARTREPLDSHVQAIAAAPLAEAVTVVTAGGSEGHLDIVPATIGPDEPKHGDDRGDRPKDEAKPDEKTERADGPPAIARLSPPQVQSGRKQDLPVTVIGSGFTAGAVILVGSDVYSAEVSKNAKRANFTLSASLLAAPSHIAIQLKNADGTLSNSVELEVVSPFAPTVAKVRPDEISSGVGGLDLQVLGDHFRDGASVKVSYLDSGSGQTVTDELKTYRLSFTHIVARMPNRLTLRAKDFNLTVTDRDGMAVSEVAVVKVTGPAIATVKPDAIVAGDVSGGETVKLTVTGKNFHSDALVFVKRPKRGSQGGGNDTFHQVPSSSIRWRSATQMNVKLAQRDVAYSGTLVLRVLNPIPGARQRDGDSSDFNFKVSGPVITSVGPAVILAGSDAFVLKLAGTDFRRGAVVRLKRTDENGEVQRSVVVDDPTFKDRKRINVPFDAEDLLRLISRPGKLIIRIINPSLGKGDPSPEQMVDIVGPTLASFELLPGEADPTQYRLKLTGEHFAEGALVQLLDADGTPVGHPQETKLRSDTEVIALLGRARVTRLRTFKVIVLNPGGTYSPEGIPSNAIDVHVD